MRKLWTIALREYRAMVATKAFLLSITLMPVMMFGSVLVASRFRDMRDTSEKTIVVVDGSQGVLFAELEKAAQTHNALFDAIAAKSTEATSPPADPAPKYRLQRHPTDVLTDAERLALSNAARAGDIVAFVEIPQSVLSESGAASAGENVCYYAPNAMLSPERQWVDRSLNDSISAHRLSRLNLDLATIREATRPVRVVPLGLFKEASDGSVRGADENRNMAGMFVPFGFMMLMFMVIMLSAQPLLESVMEEKSGRIAEVLLGSVGSFQLMLGKLLGNVAGSLSVVGIYALGGLSVAKYAGWSDMVPWDLLPWFLVFQILAVMLFGSLFMAVGASVSQLKEAQSILLPVWLLLVAPMFVWLPMVQEPNGRVATWISFFPPSTPLAMVTRLASEAAIPWWQPVAGVLLLIVTTLACIYLAGRVFRIGMLWQGKTPHVRELLRWALRG